ncbi:hypothetical protein GCM10027065_24970 [Rhodanobacter koreensis]
MAPGEGKPRKTSRMGMATPTKRVAERALQLGWWLAATYYSGLDATARAESLPGLGWPGCKFAYAIHISVAS